MIGDFTTNLDLQIQDNDTKILYAKMLAEVLNKPLKEVFHCYLEGITIDPPDNMEESLTKLATTQVTYLNIGDPFANALAHQAFMDAVKARGVEMFATDEANLVSRIENVQYYYDLYVAKGQAPEAIVVRIPTISNKDRQFVLAWNGVISNQEQFSYYEVLAYNEGDIANPKSYTHISDQLDVEITNGTYVNGSIIDTKNVQADEQTIVFYNRSTKQELLRATRPIIKTTAQAYDITFKGNDTHAYAVINGIEYPLTAHGTDQVPHCKKGTTDILDTSSGCKFLDKLPFQLLPQQDFRIKIMITLEGDKDVLDGSDFFGVCRQFGTVLDLGCSPADNLNLSDIKITADASRGLRVFPQGEIPKQYEWIIPQLDKVEGVNTTEYRRIPYPICNREIELGLHRCGGIIYVTYNQLSILEYLEHVGIHNTNAIVTHIQPGFGYDAEKNAHLKAYIRSVHIDNLF